MARKTIEVTTRLHGVTRLNCSRMGNPRFDLHTDAGTYRTQSDAACAYEVENIDRIPRGTRGLPVLLKMTPAGRVWSVEVNR